MQYKSNNNIVYSCKYHIVWCPKYRRKVLVDQVEIRLKQIILEVAQELEVEILAMETDKGHIHILA
ncbi:IS200/IS605 family transposase, partial [Helicobacter heilmannii]|uniref:IS200/IS605 family transposase n=1 Tax=Helicobacter heilmannii TaxID=35817 RepID=UPI0012E2440F